MYFCQTENVQLDEINDAHSEISSEDGTLGTSGLINLGNTCYMNSIIQCLSNCNVFRQYILSDEFIASISNKNKVNFANLNESVNSFLSYQLRRIFSNLWNSSFYSFRPITFRKLFGDKIQKFQNTGQHDSQEALMCILDTIGEELNKDIFVTPINKSINYDILNNLFTDEDINQDKIFSIIKSNLDDYLNFKSVYDYCKSHRQISSVNNIFEGRTISLLECSITGGIKAKFDSFL